MTVSSTSPGALRSSWARTRLVARWAPLVLATALLAARAIGRILRKVGHPGAALDDAYIHFQYARAFAEGHPFRFQAGEPISTGATSFLWPMLLAPFYAVGFRGEAILWPAWLLSFAALGALAYEAYALTKPLTGRGAALGAGALVIAFGGFSWSAASGMEVVPFAWLIATSTRRACEWAERPEKRTARSLVTLVIAATLCPLMRPEGAITAIALGLVVLVFPRQGVQRWKELDVSRAEALVFIAPALAPNLLLLLLTGQATSSTAQVKLLSRNPNYVLFDAALANARLLVETLLDGEQWSAEFVPNGGAALGILGLFALAWLGVRRHQPVRAALVLLLALSMFVPCLYHTFLWNRLRYLWPFATGWLVGLACLGRVAGELIGRVDPRAVPVVAALVPGVFTGLFGARLDGVIEDVAQSASGIDRQQVALGRWAREALPSGSRIGVNDTGAIAYFGDHKTFDIVGLTTPTEGRYWLHGPASRLEHYERLHKVSASSLPTHFIVYPEWMACPPVLGRTLHERIVTDATILGGQAMRASEARWDHLGTGERPWTSLSLIHDVIDVADLESEEEHGYELLGARDVEQIVHDGNAPSGDVVLDGGRGHRSRDVFFARLPGKAPLVGVVRVDGAAMAALRVLVAGRHVAHLEVEEGPWSELSFAIPDDDELRGDRVKIEVIADGPAFTSFHYWFGTP